MGLGERDAAAIKPLFQACMIPNKKGMGPVPSIWVSWLQKMFLGWTFASSMLHAARTHGLAQKLILEKCDREAVSATDFPFVLL